MPAFIDRTGKKFGHWTVLERAPSTIEGGVLRTRWKCKCDCGVERFLRAETLASKQRQGCLSCVMKDRVAAAEAREAGKTYGFWTVIKRARTRNGISKWLCRCVCGTERSIQIGALRGGHTKSCGCHNTTSEERVFYAMRTNYIAGAENRGLSWTISDEEAIRILFSPCYYCGKIPTRTLNGYSISKRHKNTPVGGIDRIDNTKGYLPGNVRPCCRACNIAKHTMFSEEFKTWVTDVYHHFVLEEDKNADNGTSSTSLGVAEPNLKVLSEEVYGYRQRRRPRREIEVRLPIHGCIENGSIFFVGREHGESCQGV